MALKLNLYHEVEKQKALNRRDPLKLSIIALSGVIAIFAGYYVMQLTAVGAVKKEYQRTTREFARLEPLAAAAKAREDELNASIRASENLVKRIEGRFYWAPVLDMLLRTVPREVQITRLSGDVGGEPGQLRCTLTLDGICAGTEARKVAEDFRTHVAQQFGTRYKSVVSTFRSLEDGVELATLDGATLPTAAFTIAVHLQPGDPLLTADSAMREVAKKD